MIRILIIIFLYSLSNLIYAQVRSRDYERMRNQFYSQIQDEKLKKHLEKIEEDILKELEVMDGEVYNANLNNAIIMELYRAREEFTRVEVIEGKEIVVLKGLDELRDDFEGRKKRIFEHLRNKHQEVSPSVQAKINKITKTKTNNQLAPLEKEDLTPIDEDPPRIIHKVEEKEQKENTIATSNRKVIPIIIFALLLLVAIWFKMKGKK